VADRGEPEVSCSEWHADGTVCDFLGLLVEREVSGVGDLLSS